MILMDQVKRSNPNTVSNPQAVLRDQFCEGVRDRQLSREIKGLLCQNPGWSILQVRKEVIRWVSEGESQSFKSKPKQTSTMSNEVAVACEATSAIPLLDNAPVHQSYCHIPPSV